MDDFINIAGNAQVLFHLGFYLSRRKVLNYLPFMIDYRKVRLGMCAALSTFLFELSR